MYFKSPQIPFFGRNKAQYKYRTEYLETYAFNNLLFTVTFEVGPVIRVHDAPRGSLPEAMAGPLRPHQLWPFSIRKALRERAATHSRWKPSWVRQLPDGKSNAKPEGSFVGWTNTPEATLGCPILNHVLLRDSYWSLLTSHFLENSGN